ncbi:three-helix bundle dimerization domain-containing protein (plasmid) [Mycolicibacterium psychrotolerans]|uniref:three-helix bundle dimerization domain-containing protein n=1 Tax=Mycolicibacterium psychrotolerans TaxID=216929 RepID=UPI003D66521C
MVKSLDERTQLDEIVERLSAAYPTMTAAAIAEVVTDLHARFRGAPVREFIPLFVERDARHALDELSVSYA